MGTISVLFSAAIGMIVIYFFGALLVSSLQELVASILQWRAKHLEESILQLMLSRQVDDDSLKKAKTIQRKIYENPLIQSMNQVSFSRLMTWNILKPLLTFNFVELSNNFKQIIHFNREEEKTKIYKKIYSTANPSYLEPENFATVIIEELSKEVMEGGEMPSQKIEDFKKKIQGSQKLPKSLQGTLASLADRAATKVQQGENEILAFHKEIETWFNRSMQEASGVYKRNSQAFCFLLGFLLSVLLNLDSIQLYNRIIKDTSLRTALVNSASVIVKSSQTNGEINSAKLETNINNIVGNTLPINLITQQATNLVDCPKTKLNGCSITEGAFNPKKVLQALIGWLITTIAIYMGAPFWFQLLTKIVNVRATGNKPTS